MKVDIVPPSLTSKIDPIFLYAALSPEEPRRYCTTTKCSSTEYCLHEWGLLNSLESFIILSSSINWSLPILNICLNLTSSKFARISFHQMADLKTESEIPRQQTMQWIYFLQIHPDCLQLHSHHSLICFILEAKLI